MSDAHSMILAVEEERRFELTRRIGYAKAQIAEALRHSTGDRLTQVALRRALAELNGDTDAGAAR